jgi:hypothetical protein
MGLDGGGKNDDVDARVCCQQLRQVIENGYWLCQPALRRRVRVRHGNKLDGAGFLESRQIGQVPFTEAVDAYQGYAGNGMGGRGGRSAPSRVGAVFRGGGWSSHEEGPWLQKGKSELKGKFEIEGGD